MSTKTQSQFVSIEFFAAAAGIHPVTAYRKAKSGEIPSVRLGKRVLIPASFLDLLEKEALGQNAGGAV